MNKKETEEKPAQKKKTVARNEKGQFAKGSAKAGGRKAGTPNKYGNIRDRLKDIIMPYLNYEDTASDGSAVGKKKPHSFASDLLSIDDPKDRIDAVAKILPFIVPKYSATTISADTNRPLSEEEQLLELEQKYKKKEVEINIKALTIVDNDNPRASSINPFSPSSGEYDPDDDPNFNLDDLQ